MLYISVFCKHIETCLNIGYNLVLSAKVLSKTATSQWIVAVLSLYTYKNTCKLPDNPNPYKCVGIKGNQKEGRYY